MGQFLRPAQAQFVEVLKTVKDPEIGHNVWDLGLIYGIDVAPDGRVTVRMTMTTPFCPYGPALVDEVKSSLSRAFPNLPAVSVIVVWDPPWGLEKVSPAVRAELGLT